MTDYGHPITTVIERNKAEVDLLKAEISRLQSVIAGKDRIYRNLDKAFQISKITARALEALLIDAQMGKEGPLIPLHHHVAEVKKLQDTISAYNGDKAK